ncbi:MAG: CDP-alcohol phosphatidyltransferase family protein [Myxococcota bacterium]
MDSRPELRPDALQSWSRWHALVALAAAVAAAFSAESSLFGLAAASSLLTLVWVGRGQYTPSGAFGPANWLTLARLGGIVALPWLPAVAMGPALLAFLALDGLDGFVARKTGASSVFGAHFDMETDAVFVAATSLELFTRGVLGAWVLLAGGLRYAYVLCLWCWRARRGDAPRSRWGRYAFFVLVLGLSAPWMLGTAVGAAAAAFGCAVVTLSFARSFYYSYSRG